ncbi:hypothetical protein RvY_09231-1 [Ramazzottius varieornatus]|uniref:Uncharacterized protein n=1 Tax=Ramazzottius varieornatus TaxID=947166 RepID=A0A1D1VE60_RAMVA|nr:hypothetical protein RvY_09231-1 [Ramazzottius varieornatus]
MGHSASGSVMDVADDETDELSSDADQNLELIRIADRVEEEEMAETWLNAAVDEAETMETKVLPIVVEAASKPSDAKEVSPPEHPVESNPQTSTQFSAAKSKFSSFPPTPIRSIETMAHYGAAPTVSGFIHSSLCGHS